MIYSDKKHSNWGTPNKSNWNGICYHWRVLGEESNQAILLLHGFGASSEHWRNNANFFVEAGFRVYGLDLIGFGKSEQPSKKKISRLDNKIWSEQVAHFVKEVIQQKNSKKIILIGNSLGALTALTVSAFYPSLFSAVIAAPLPEPALKQSFQLELPKFLRKIKDCLIKLFFNILPLELLIPIIANTKIIEVGLQFAYQKSIRTDIDLQRIVKEPAQRNTAARSLRAMCIGMGTRSKFHTAPFLLNSLSKRTVRPSVLLVWGRKDKIVPLIIGKRLISRYHWIKLIILENTGHCPHDESPGKFNQYVLDWLKVNL